MKNVQLNIGVRNKDNSKNIVFRSTNISDLSDDLSILRYLDPIMIIDESLVDKIPFEPNGNFPNQVMPDEIINVIDNDIPVNGVSYLGPVANGLNKPNVICSELIYDSVNSVYIPYIRLSLDYSSNGVVYYYVSVCVDNLSNVSRISKIIPVKLEQDINDLKYTLQVSDNYNQEDKSLITWTDLDTNLTVNNYIEIGCPDTTNYNLYGKIVNETVPTFNANEVIFNKHYVSSEGNIVISFPNVWHNIYTKYSYRLCKAYRLISNIGNEKSEVSEAVNIFDSKYIPVEKLIVIKRNVTLETDKERPSGINESNTSIIKTYIRKNGLYYSKELHVNRPYNVTDANSDIIIMSSNSIFDITEIKNVSCVTGQSYNFTFYLYDSYGTISEPISTVINL